MSVAYEIVAGTSDYVLCDDCNIKRLALRSALGEKYQENRAHFQGLMDNPSTPAEIKEYFRKFDEAVTMREQKKEKMEAEKVRFNNTLENLLMTTGSVFDGYRVVEYLEIVSEEVIFKNSFMNRLSAGFEDLGNAFSFSETEMSGSGDLIARAREYVMEKFRHKVVKLGANAVLGVEFESSIGSDIVRVAVFGTAVVVEKSS